jgi:hypothetical protein
MIRATDFYSEEAYYAALDERVATEAEADREFADAVGRDRPDQAWLLSDRDVWYANPFYQGPAVRHPEDDADDYEDEDGPGRPVPVGWIDALDDMPF